MTESVLIIGMRSNQMFQSRFKTLILDLNTRKVCNLCTLTTAIGVVVHGQSSYRELVRYEVHL